MTPHPGTPGPHAAPPYAPGDEVLVLLWDSGLSGWRRATVAAVAPDTGPSGYAWAVTVENPWPDRERLGLPATITVGSWDNGHGNGLRPG